MKRLRNPSTLQHTEQAPQLNPTKWNVGFPESSSTNLRTVKDPTPQVHSGLEIPGEAAYLAGSTEDRASF